MNFDNTSEGSFRWRITFIAEQNQRTDVDDIRQALPFMDCSWYRYSADQCHQNRSRHWRKSWCRERRLGISASRDGSRNVTRGSPIKKCLGVNASKSEESFDIGYKDCELSIASTLTRIVLNSSYISKVSPMIRFRWNFTDFIAASHLPPKCGAEGKLNCHVVPSETSPFLEYDGKEETQLGVSSDKICSAIASQSSIGSSVTHKRWNATRNLCVE